MWAIVRFVSMCFSKKLKRQYEWSKAGIGDREKTMNNCLRMEGVSL